MLRAGSWIAFSVLAMTAPVAVSAKPLGAEACAELKQRRDALVTSGARDVLLQPPAAGLPAERTQQAKLLIDVEGQLRFRCATDLPIQSLRPEQIVELPDQVEGEARPKENAKGVRDAAPKAVAKAPSPKPKKAKPVEADGTAPTGAETPGAPAQPAHQRKTADKTTEIGAAAKPRPKPAPQDAYKPSSDTGLPHPAQ